MTSNMGTLDRLVRFSIGIVLVLLPFASGLAVFQSGVATLASVAVGLVMLATATLRFCPLYAIFGIRTCRA